ncbi:MAG: hypothetical protein DRJ40_09750 [Thermoprotei archaeon]|nr:MAG: hypothetical protein DRJ40_09750 [Thermoprotei archaeon]
MCTSVDVNTRIRVYISDARKFIEEAIEEFQKGTREGNVMAIRDAAEKAWNAVVQASNALVLKFMGKVPSSHWERRRLLRELERRNVKIAEYGFRDRYCARERNLHELVFYEGIIDIEDVEDELEKAKKYVDDVVKVIEST